jgi:uncharacterized protein YjbI with pentapeptide repeats
MEPIKVQHARTRLDVSSSCADGSRFFQVMLEKSRFEDVNMAGVKIMNANLSDLEIEGAQLGGAYIHNIGMPPEGHPMYDPEAKMRPLRLEDCNLENSTIENCNLSGVRLKNCNISGLTIDGVDIGLLLEKYGSK